MTVRPSWRNVHPHSNATTSTVSPVAATASIRDSRAERLGDEDDRDRDQDERVDRLGDGRRAPAARLRVAAPAAVEEDERRQRGQEDEDHHDRHHGQVEVPDATELILRVDAPDDGVGIPTANGANRPGRHLENGRVQGSDPGTCLSAPRPNWPCPGTVPGTWPLRAALFCRDRGAPPGAEITPVEPDPGHAGEGSAVTSNDTPSWGIEPVPERLRVLGIARRAAALGEPLGLAARDRRGRVPRAARRPVRARALAARGARRDRRRGGRRQPAARRSAA